MQEFFVNSSGEPTLQAIIMFVALIIILTTWSIVWKGLALWKAAKLSDKTWFVVLLILNTAGILEIIYIYLISKRKDNTTALPAANPKI